MIWRVQTAWSQGLHPAFIGREQHLAERDVSRLLGTWIVKNLLKLSALFTERGGHADFALQASFAANGIVRLLDAGDVWGAYDLLHSFQDRFENEFNSPIWSVVGTVIVEAPPGLGPATRKRFLTEEDLALIPPGGPRMDGAGLGAFRRWRIAWSDHMGQRHDDVFVREDEAMAHLGRLLSELADRLHGYMASEAVAQVDDPGITTYAEEALAVAAEIKGLLHAGLVQEAYNRWRWFESESIDRTYPGVAHPGVLQSMIGTVRLEVD